MNVGGEGDDSTGATHASGNRLAAPMTRDRAVVDAAGVVGLAGYAALAWYSRGTLQEPTLAAFFALVAWVSVPPAAAFLLCRRSAGAFPATRMLCWAALFRLAGLFGVPLFEDDWHRYLWDGYRFAETGTPYGWAPAQSFADADLPGTFQRILDQVNYPDLPTIYGPTTQLAFLLAYLMAPGSLAPLQLLLIAVDLVLIRLLLSVAPARFALLYAWCPLVVKEVAFTAHPDGIAVCLAVLAVLLHRRERATAAAVCLAFAVGAKVFALLLVPFVLLPRRLGRSVGAASPVLRPRTVVAPALAFLATLALLYAPFVVQGGTDLTALLIFAQAWEFNAALYAVVAAALPPTAAKALLGILLLVAVAAYWLFWNRREELNGAGQRLGTAPPPARSSLAQGIPRADWLFGGLLLVSPVINPWYALWFLPFAAVFPSRWAWTAAWALLLSYVTGANLGIMELEPFAQPAWVRPVEFGAILLALAADGIARRKRASWRVR